MPRTFALLLAAVAGCAKVPRPEPVPEPPAVPVGGDPARLPAKGPADGGRPKVEPAGDPADPALAGKKLSEWRADARAGDGSGRQKTAVRVLALYGPAAAPATPDLVRDDPRVTDIFVANDILRLKREAIRAIGPGAAPYLVAELKSPNPRSRVFAWYALAEMGPGAAGEVDALTALLKDPVAAPIAADVLSKLGEAGKKAVPELTRLLKHQDPNVRLAAAGALADLDPSVEAAIPVLFEAAGQVVAAPEGTAVASQVVKLARFGAAGREEYLKLLKAAKRPDGFANSNLWPSEKAPEAVRAAAAPVLVALAKSLPEKVAFAPLERVNRMQVKSPEAAAAALELVTPTGPLCGYGAQVSLACGAPADKLGPAVLAALRGAKPESSAETSLISVAGALGPAVGKAGADAIRPFLASANAQTRGTAAGSLARLNPADADATKVLLEFACGVGVSVADSSFARHNARVALDALPAASAAGAKPHLDHPNPEVRRLAAGFIVRRDVGDAKAAKLAKELADWSLIDEFRKAGAGGAPHLADLLAHPKPGIRQGAARALARMGPDAAPAAAALAKLVQEGGDAERLPALTALGRIGAPARPHLGAVRANLKAELPTTRLAAAVAFAVIAADDPARLEPLVSFVRDNKRADLDVSEEYGPIPKPGEEPVQRTGRNVPLPNLHDAAVDRLFELDLEAAVKAGGYGDTPQRRP